jgi:class 3 adenylate cyclase
VDLAAAAKFCPECGTQRAVAPSREVRKTVTLLFTDVTGSTALGEQLDPESYRSVMGRYFAVSRAAVERHGGTVEKFVGDAVLAVFGVPDVREDDAVRAVRAAQELNQAVAELSEELTSTLGVRLEIRTGVNTGSVVVGASRAGGSFATGDAVNTAARLEQAARPGEVLLGQATYELVRDAVQVEETDPVVAKGKAEPVRAFRLLQVDQGAEGRQRRTDVELIGRARETRALDDALERTLESGRSHLVTVTGAPGVGKSRLVAEFLDRVGDRAAVLRGRCVSYGQGITYWPVIQLLREACGLEGDESREVTQHALLQVLPRGAEDRQNLEAVELLLPLLGKGGESGGSDQTFWAVSRVLEQLALRRPLVVTVDDLHWAEPTLLELLDRVRDETRDLPLLLVCQARPELLDEHPDWGQGSLNSTTFGLEPFDDSHTAASLSALLGPGVPDAVATAVAGWSGGNPLFVEEIATHLVETGILARTADGWQVTGDLATAGVPPTVSALLAARLDRLPDTERGLLERVSVIGLEFTTAQAALLADPAHGDKSSSVLMSLARRDLLRRVRNNAGDIWAFRHAIVRDSAYDALPKALRAELHIRVADYLSEHEDEAGGENLAFVAHHLGQASQYAGLLAPHDPATRALADRAALAFIQAADGSRLREDLAGAAALLGDALDLHAGSLIRRDASVRLQQVYNSMYDADGLGRATDAFASTLDGDAPATELDQAHLELVRAHHLLLKSEDIDPGLLLPLADRTIALARAAGDRRREVMALTALASTHAMRAQWRPNEELFAKVRALGDPQDRREADQWGGATRLYGPRPLSDMVEESHRQVSQAKSARQRVTHQLSEAMGRAAQGDPEGPSLVDAAVVAVQEISDDEMVFATMRAMAKLLAGDPQAAREMLEASVQATRNSGDFSYGSTYLAWQALVELELGTDLATVEAMVDEADEWTSRYDVMSVSFVAAARAVLAARSGDLVTAAEQARAAVETVDTGDQTWQRADVRRWVSEVAQARSDVGEERRLLTEALELYAAKEIVTWNAQVQARLDELSS